jgi:plasmid stabilization system protein ParE
MRTATAGARCVPPRRRSLAKPGDVPHAAPRTSPHLHPLLLAWASEAANELRGARRWYAQEASVSVAARFLAEFHRLRRILSQQPLRSPEIEPGIRRLLCQDRFPYALIVAVMHQHREPGYWRDRIEGTSRG